jgi:hypothetical protein
MSMEKTEADLLETMTEMEKAIFVATWGALHAASSDPLPCSLMENSVAAVRDYRDALRDSDDVAYWTNVLKEES